ncbi:hypothetical protein HYC85_029105 [Camellia sinensis]|uniref:Uncharacterized protein n=1 Tax=Camellia sinensis TaxID=4442 RepID=A0A7J7G0Z6_CAMSI|nr:hypothetical protein HYC85_029105 [Camellia sinensis]
MFNGQPQCEGCVARFEATLELGARKSDQKDQVLSKEACEAKSEAPARTRGKNVRCARRVKNWDIAQANEDRQECQIPEGRKEESIAEGQSSSYPQHWGQFSPPLDGLLHRQRTAVILLDSDDFRISKSFDMDKATLLPLRGSLGRKLERATQAKVRVRKMQKKKNEEKEKNKRRK